MNYSEEEALTKLPEASSGPNFYGVGEHDHIELIDHIFGLFTDVPNIPYYWITARLNTAYKGHGSIWYTEMKEMYGRRNWPWWKSQIIQKKGNVAGEYLENHFPNWEKKLSPTKSKNIKSESGQIKSIWTIIKDIIVPHGKVGFRLNQEFVVLHSSHIQGLLLGTDYQIMYGIDI
ncbi:hypothetical protein O181_067819 [Austropuccinia psidii MF-1]|uniref:Uncharacterized protein n=1 Tax=Austropuccinia psidii MF-1 TaxID=1389203 RepID=A0A9Q3EVR2_9BASI|nr:hypothetical protein [Austropuccinia psidii MF-1]